MPHSPSHALAASSLLLWELTCTAVGTNHSILELFMKGSLLPLDCWLFKGQTSVLFTAKSSALSQAGAQQMINN